MLALASGAAYALTYFFRYPVFMLPSEYSEAHVGTLFGTPLDLQISLSMAFTFGFACGKPVAIPVVTSKYFFEHRLAFIIWLLAGSAFIEGVGVWAFGSTPILQVLAVFLSSFLGSFQFGAMITYLEGRQNTEFLLAVSSGFFIFAGNLARGTAQLLLDWGVPPLTMPLVIALFAGPLSCLLVVYIDRQPRPSPADIAARSKRSSMSYEQKKKFLTEWWPAVATLLPSYALTMGIRSFRDLFAGPLFAASLGVSQAPAALFFAADLPGAVVSVLALVFFSRVRDNRRAVWLMLVTIIGGLTFTFGVTLLFMLPSIGGIAWQLMLGTGLFLAYSVLGSPLYERIFAVGRVEGTISFLVFGSDLSGYVATLAIFLYSIFGGKGGDDDEGYDDDDGDDDADTRRYNKEILRQFLEIFWGCGVVAAALAGCALVYFLWRLGAKDPLLKSGDDVAAPVAQSSDTKKYSTICRPIDNGFGEEEDPAQDDEGSDAAAEGESQNEAYSTLSPLVDSEGGSMVGGVGRGDSVK